MGQQVTPQQLQAEWAEYQVTLDSMLRTFSMYLARLAKQRKREIEKRTQELEQGPSHNPPPSDPKVRKAHLRRAVAAGLGFPIQRAPTFEELRTRQPRPNGDEPPIEDDEP